MDSWPIRLTATSRSSSRPFVAGVRSVTSSSPTGSNSPLANAVRGQQVDGLDVAGGRVRERDVSDHERVLVGILDARSTPPVQPSAVETNAIVSTTRYEKSNWHQEADELRSLIRTPSPEIVQTIVFDHTADVRPPLRTCPKEAGEV